MNQETEMTKVNIHYHLGNDRNPESGKYKHTADRTLGNYESHTKSFNVENAEKDIELAIQKGYGIFAITNSNIIYHDEIEKLINKYGDNICLIPGVEVNLKSFEEIDKYLHVVVLFDPSNYTLIKDKSLQLDKFIENNNSPFLTYDEFIDFVYDPNIRSVIAAHGIKQDNRSCELNPDLFKELISLDDVIPVLIEDSKKFHKEQLRIRLKENLSINNEDLNWLDKATSISSLDRRDFGEIEGVDYIWGNSTFDDLFFASLMGGDRILKESDIAPRKNYIKRIEIIPSAKTQIEKCNLDFSYGLNTIVGASGSGKTLLLEIIFDKLSGETLKNKTISQEVNYKDIYDPADIKIFNEKDEEMNSSFNYTVYEGKNLYKEIIETYSDDSDKLLKKFDLEVSTSRLENTLDYYFRSINNEIDKKRKIRKNEKKIDVEMTRMQSSLDYLQSVKILEPMMTLADSLEKGSSIITLTNVLNSYKKDYESLLKDFEDIKTLGKKYSVRQGTIEELEKLKETFFLDVVQYGISKEIELLEKDKTNRIIDKMTKVKDLYNVSLGKRTAEYASQTETFGRTITNVIRIQKESILLEKSKHISLLNKKDLLDAIKIEEHDYFRLEKKVNQSISLEQYFTMFQSSIGNKPKINKSKISNAFLDEKINMFDVGSMEKIIDIYYQHGSDEISLDYSRNSYNLAEYDIEVKTSDNQFQSIKTVTAGNLAKVYINYMFEKDIKREGSNVLVIYDQPESNMEKKFIHDILSDKIKDLRLTSQVIIATHEPLLVVNADSNQIILASNDKLLSNKNSIKYENISFVGTNSKSEMIRSLANLIDGDPEAVSKRNKIYGGMINNEKNEIE